MSSTGPTHRIVVSDAVARELGNDEAHQLRIGELMKSEYQCLACDQPGDTRTDESSAIVLTSDTSMMLALAHTACAPSEVHPIADLKKRYHSAGEPRPAPRRPEDETLSTVVSLDGTEHPALIIVPGDNFRARVPGSSPAATVDSAVEKMRLHGWADVDLSGRQRPVELDRWAVHLVHGKLGQITKPGGTWWRSANLPPLDPQWAAAARATRRALVMVIATEIPACTDQARRRAAVAAAATSGGLIGALMPIRGSFS